MGSKEGNYIERYWRDATPEDAIKEPPMVARFKYEDAEDWEYDLLVGWDRTDKCRWRSELDAFEQCQVYDAPDPGEGWRLIDVEKDRPCENDEIWSGYKWTAIEYFSNFCLPNHYRRRIEPPKPQYVPFTWEDREQLRGRWYKLTLSYGEIRECQIEFLRLDRNVFFIGSFPSDELLQKNARFLDTGEPVGKRVD